MRKSLSPSLSDSLGTTRVFGIPLEEVPQSGQAGQEVPLLVKHIVEYIEEHGGLDLEGLFLVNGNAERVEWLRQRYDSGEEVDLEKEADLASAVSLLRLFLQELPEPVIPASLQARILQLYQDQISEEELASNMKYYLQQLPQVNYCLLRFLCRFLSNVASLQEESWSTGALAAVFGPDIFHLDTDVEDLKEQKSVSRILADLLENQEDFFDSEEEDFSTNDYSSINEQITELLDDEKLEQCEELPRDSEDSPEDERLQDPPELTQVTPSSRHVCQHVIIQTDLSHITPINILPASAEFSMGLRSGDWLGHSRTLMCFFLSHSFVALAVCFGSFIIERTIRAAVEQHLFDLQSTIDQEISSYEIKGTSSQDNQGEAVSKEAGTEPSEADKNAAQTGHIEAQHPDFQPGTETDGVPETMDHDKCHCILFSFFPHPKLLDIVQGLGDCVLRQESCQVSDNAAEDDVITCAPHEAECDLNANLESVGCPRQPNTAPHLALHGIFQDGQWEDPVPAFKSWQEDCESGEAQLSPLAGRMVPPPLEEDAHPLHARRFLDFGHSQRFLQQDPDSNSSTTALSLGRPRRSSFSSKDSGKVDPVPHQLTKKLQNLKKKIKQFEEQFEKERNYKPSHGDKAANPKVLKWMTDLTKIRKQIKDTKQKASEDLTPQPRPRSNTLPKSFGSTLDQGASEGLSEGDMRARRPVREETLEVIQRRLKGKREEDGRPEDIRKMTKEHLSCEKTVLQKNLLYYESIHGRPVTREERLIVKPLYDRYRLVKQMLTRASITPIIASPSSKRRSQMLQPIIEGETAHFCDEIKEEEEEEEEEEEGGVFSQSSQVTILLDPAAQPPQAQLDGEISPKAEESGGKLALDLRLSSSNASSMPELLEQLWKARADKKKLRKSIREFEDEFYQQNGRNVQKEDRAPMMDEYKEYKRIKAKLRLLEVLISKQDSSKSI
ncbi:FA13B protein, partial [Amia calva]|nr:FA13B protein [Amia calva]